ncbi:MAG: hypothetical protein Q8O67_27930 [Deltaproteobacteria bacterium]|nr:hypothetical protein [Deltaproteobacteria bacterium]
METQAAAEVWEAPRRSFNDDVEANAARLFAEGQAAFRWDTFGNEAFWGDELGLHEALLQLTPRELLELGLKLDVSAMPARLARGLRLDDPNTTADLLRAGAVVGVVVVQERKRIVSVGVTCGLCHSTVDDVRMKGVGRRLDGWANPDLDVGALVSLAPGLADSSREQLRSWGPGRCAVVDDDGAGFRPDPGRSAVSIPAVFGLAGRSIVAHPGWRSLAGNPKQPALHFYALAIPRPQ